MGNGKVVAVLPAYNAAMTLEKTITSIPAGSVSHVILVDDCSQDDTVGIAKRLGLDVTIHSKNIGYGGNQKTCYKLALETEADFIVLLHPDYQYDARVIPVAIDILRLGICDIVLGNRIRTRNECLSSGMPLYKYWGNRFLTGVENVCLGQNLGEFHSGFRAYRREVLEKIPFKRNSDDFVFDSQFLVQAVHLGFKIGDVPMPVRYFKQASSINLRRSFVYGISTLAVLLEYLLHRLRIVKSPLFCARKEENPSLRPGG